MKQDRIRKMLLCSLVGIVFMFVMIGSAESNLSCDRIPSAVTACPSYGTLSTPRSKHECENDGCYYCEGLTPTCVEGAGCSLLDMSPSNECKSSIGRRILDRRTCRARGCSWCEDSSSGIKCYTNPTSPTEMVPSPICSGQRSTSEYDCRNQPDETLTAIDCVKRKGCSWCESNTAFKCVKDPSLTPIKLTCTGSETLHCFPFPTVSIAKDKCEKEIGCVYCANATEDKRCMRSECPAGWILRKDGKSCCQTPAGSSTPSRSMSWLVEYRAGTTTCEGFVVSPTRVITAGQCLTTNNGAVIPGSVYTDSNDVSAATVIPVSQVVRTPYFVNLFLSHDIAVLKLASAVPSTVQPLSLPLGEVPPVGMTCYVGTFEGNSLTEHKTDIFSDADCFLRDDKFDKNFQLCAQLSDGSASNFCAGKPGSPLVCQRCKSCEWYAYGIASYFLPDCNVPYPKYYTKLSFYTDFLKANEVPVPDNNYNCQF